MFSGEAARIQQCKGRVFALQDEPEVARVWLPNNDSPGLAMARAFGDFCLKDFGLISVPDIYYRCLSEKDEFIILATDGVSFSFPICYFLSHSQYAIYWKHLLLVSETSLPCTCDPFLGCHKFNDVHWFRSIFACFLIHLVLPIRKML